MFLLKHIAILSFCSAALLVLTTGHAQAQPPAAADNTAKRVVLFTFDSAGVDGSFMDDTQGLTDLRSILTDKVFLSQPDSVVITGASAPEHEPVPTVSAEPEKIFALRTNLLFDAIGAPNVAVEVPLGRRFSISADYAYAYMQIRNTYAVQTNQASLEGRFWVRPGKNILTGWNIGIYGTYCGRYDIQWKRGYQGDGFWSAGLSVGYAIPLSRNFNIDFSIAGGYFYTPEVREYYKENDKLIWTKTRYNYSTISLLKVRVNLVWLIDAKKK